MTTSFYNDYCDMTDAEYDRREHAYELGSQSGDEIAFGRWSDAAVGKLMDCGATTGKQGLDADEETDGFSLDFAYDAFRAGEHPHTYVARVLAKRQTLGFHDKEVGLHNEEDDL